MLNFSDQKGTGSLAMLQYWYWGQVYQDIIGPIDWNGLNNLPSNGGGLVPTSPNVPLVLRRFMSVF